MKTLKQHYKYLIIGFGKGGKTLAAYLAKHGQEVALIERSDKMYGGTCINIACIPTKSLIVNAEKGMPFSVAYQKKNELTSFLRAKNFENVNGLELAAVITGEAAFVSPHEVNIKLGGSKEDIRVSADNIYINTGTLPLIPAISGIEVSKNVFTSTSLMEQSVRPERLIVIGGGFIGLEFADMYAKFGVAVTILDNNKVFLPHEDRDIAEEMFKLLTAKGIDIVNGADIEHIQDLDNHQVEVNYKGENGALKAIKSDAILIATGRKPNTESLNVAAADVKLDKRGFIVVDDHLKTNQPHIWAIGDINGGPQFTYISLDDFRIIKDQLFGDGKKSVSNRKEVAFSVFTSPSLSHIGLREREAIERGYQIKVAKLPAAAVPKARILSETNGLLKAIVDVNTDKILGCTLFCADSHEMVNTIQVAINARLNYQEVRDSIFTHPSMSEAFNDLFSLI